MSDSPDEHRPNLENVIYGRLIGEFDWPGMTWLRLAMERKIWRIPLASCVIAALGIVTGLFALCSGTGAVGIVFEFPLKAPIHNVTAVRFNHVLGFFAEANYALWLIVGLPLFLTCGLNVLKLTSKGIARMIQLKRVRVNGGWRGEALVPAWAASRRCGFAMLGLFLVGCVASIGMQVANFGKASRAAGDNWPHGTNGPQVDLERFCDRNKGFDIGNTLVPLLQSPMVEAFESLPVTDKFRVLYGARRTALLWAWVEMKHRSMQAVPSASSIDQVYREMEAAALGVNLRLLPQPLRATGWVGTIFFWAYVILAAGLTGLGWGIALWLLVKIALSLRAISLIVRDAVPGAFELVPRWQDPSIGLKPLLTVDFGLLLVAVSGSVYVILMRPVPVSFTDTYGRLVYIRDGWGGFTLESEVLNVFIAGTLFLLLSFVALRWFLVIKRLSEKSPAPYAAEDFSGFPIKTWGALLGTIIAILLPISVHFPNPVADKLLPIPRTTKWLSSKIFGLPQHGAESLDRDGNVIAP